MHKIRVIQSIIATVAIVIIVAALRMWQRAKEEPIKIGTILSLSDPGGPSAIGIEVRDGILLAVEKINSWIRTG